MNFEHFMAWSILFMVLALIASGKSRMDLAALGGLIILGLAGIAPPQVIFSGFGHPALATIIAVFLVSQGIVDSKLLRGLGQTLAGKLHTLHAQVLSIAAVGSFLSAFMNNVGAVGLMLPTAVRMARRFGTLPGSFGLPLAMTSILGGTVTLIGSAPNIIIASFMHSAAGHSFKMFDFAPHGLAMLAVTFILLAVCRSCGFDPGSDLTSRNNKTKTSKDTKPDIQTDPCNHDNDSKACDEPNNLSAHEKTSDDLEEKIIFSPFSSPHKQITLIIMLAAVSAVSLGLIHPAYGFGSAAILLIAGKILSPHSAYKNIDLKIVFFLGSMLGIGQTLEHSGGLDLLSTALADYTKGLEPFWLILVIIIVSSILSNAINNAAAAVFMAPLAIAIAAEGNLTTAAALMATAAGSNLTLLLPTHQATLMVMSKAPFPVGSFLRFGLIVSFFCIIIAAAVITAVWQ